MADTSSARRAGLEETAQTPEVGSGWAQAKQRFAASGQHLLQKDLEQVMRCVLFFSFSSTPLDLEH